MDWLKYFLRDQTVWNISPTCVGGGDAPPLSLHSGWQPGGRGSGSPLATHTLPQDPHLDQLGALQVLLQHGVVRDGELPAGLVVGDDEGWVPLGGSLHPVHGQPLPEEDWGGGEEEPLGRSLLQPASHLSLSPGSDSQPRQWGVPVLARY